MKRKKVKQESEIETGIYHKISSSSFPDPESPISGQVRTYEPTNLQEKKRINETKVKQESEMKTGTYLK